MICLQDVTLEIPIPFSQLLIYFRIFFCFEKTVVLSFDLQKFCNFLSLGDKNCFSSVPGDFEIKTSTYFLTTVIKHERFYKLHRKFIFLSFFVKMLPT